MHPSSYLSMFFTSRSMRLFNPVTSDLHRVKRTSERICRIMPMQKRWVCHSVVCTVYPDSLWNNDYKTKPPTLSTSRTFISHTFYSCGYRLTPLD